MKKYFNFCLMLVVSMLALFVSPDVALAVAVGENGSDTDPNAGTPLETATPDDLGKGIDQQGHAATGSVVDQADLGEDQITDYVSKYKAYRFPMHTDFLRIAQQIKVNTKEPENYEIAEPVMQCVTKGATASTSSGTPAVYEETAVLNVFGNDKKLFKECGTFVAMGVTGYTPTGVADNTPLVLYVESAPKGGNVTVRALNGPISDGHTYVPTIAAGTTLLIMAPAMTESEIEIRPDNILPQPVKCYLQKKVCAITWTEFFERIKKKANWTINDVKDAILFKFRLDCTFSMLLSAPSKFMKTNDRTGTEYGYTQNGALRQLRLAYELEDGQMNFGDLIGMTAMLFGTYDTPDEMTAYCGKRFIERFLNINFKEHNEIIVRNYEDETLKIKYTAVETTFGKIKFVHEHALDLIGYTDCAVIYDPKQSRRFYYVTNKKLSVDHSKGEGGEVREAKTEYYVQDDCLSLRGYNSMIVGPKTLISGFSLSPIETTIHSVDELPAAASSTAGDVVYLTKQDGANAIGLYEFDGTNWKAYSGREIHV